MKVVDLTALAKEGGLRGYFKFRKAELITFLQNNLRPTPPQRTIPAPRPSPRPTPTLKPYHLRPKKGKETFIEDIEMPPPPSNRKQIKRMKKKLSKLSKKIRHSKRKRNNLISMLNSIKKKIEELKGSREQNEEVFSPVEVEQAFGRAYRSYRNNRRNRMDVDTFFDRIRQNLIDLMKRELVDLGSVMVQRTAWMRFRMEALFSQFYRTLTMETMPVKKFSIYIFASYTTV